VDRALSPRRSVSVGDHGKSAARLTIAKRTLVAILIGLACGAVTAILMLPREPSFRGFDFTYPWFAAREVLGGRDPYVTIVARPMPNASVLFYPLTAAIAALPFAALSAPAAAITFITLSCTLLAFVLSGRGR